MKKFAITGLLFALSLMIAAIGDAKGQSFTVTNKLALSRADEIISIPISSLPASVSRDKLNSLIVREPKNIIPLLSQLVDNDQDGKADELLFRASIGPKETKTFIMGAGSKTVNPPRLDVSTFARPVPERQNDFAWENDRVAFRVYGSQPASSNGRRPVGGAVDAFLKRVSYPVINKWYRNNAEKEGAYHIDTGEGHDPYQVGDSRGMGGTGIWMGDSLYASGNYISSKVIAEGPLRTIFELTFAPWDASGIQVNEVKRISLDLGSHLSKVTQLIKSAKPVPNIVSGITLHDKSGEVKLNRTGGWFSFWERINDSWLASAIVADPAVIIDAKDHRTDARDQSHLLVFMKPANPTFYTGFAWQKSGHFKDQQEWENYLADFSQRIRSPLVVEFNR